MELPEINQRIKNLIETHADGNTSKFCRLVDITPSYKLTRLFSVEPRNNKYPEPSLDIVKQIAKTLDLDLNYLIFGKTKFSESMVNEVPKEYLTQDAKLDIIIQQNRQILDQLKDEEE
jgi:hypothetical protein